jgi:hypothetical protein
MNQWQILLVVAMLLFTVTSAYPFAGEAIKECQYQGGIIYYLIYRKKKYIIKTCFRGHL